MVCQTLDALTKGVLAGGFFVAKVGGAVIGGWHDVLGKRRGNDSWDSLSSMGGFAVTKLWLWDLCHQLGCGLEAPRTCRVA